MFIMSNDLFWIIAAIVISTFVSSLVDHYMNWERAAGGDWAYIILMVVITFGLVTFLVVSINLLAKLHHKPEEIEHL